MQKQTTKTDNEERHTENCAHRATGHKTLKLIQKHRATGAQRKVGDGIDFNVLWHRLIRRHKKGKARATVYAWLDAHIHETFDQFKAENSLTWADFSGILHKAYKNGNKDAISPLFSMGACDRKVKFT